MHSTATVRPLKAGHRVWTQCHCQCLQRERRAHHTLLLREEKACCWRELSITPVVVSVSPSAQMPPRTLGNLEAAGWLTLWTSVMALAHRKEAKRKKDPVESDRSAVLRRRQKWVDHPMAAWLLENGTVWCMVLTRLVITRGREFFVNGCSQWERFISVFCGMIASDRLGLMIQHVLVHYVYGHIPYFHDKVLIVLT